MIILLPQRRQVPPEGEAWFAWHPVIAAGQGGSRFYLTWLRTITRKRKWGGSDGDYWVYGL